MSVLCYVLLFFFFKQKTAYEMRISDWSSDVCSSDLQSRIPEAVVIGPLPVIFEFRLVARLVVRGVEIMRAGRQARLHDRQVLIGKGEVDDMRRAGLADERRSGVDMVGVNFGGPDRDAGARLHRFGDRVAFELAAAGQRDVGEDIGVRKSTRLNSSP